MRAKRTKISGFVHVALLTLAAFCAASSQAAAQGEQPVDNTIASTDAVVRGLCSSQVALLGESPTHSFGNSLAFKVAVVRRLVNECQFNALLIESGLYDYVHIQQQLRAGEDVSDQMIAAAIGGLWANDEVRSLVPFLREKVKAGTLTLGGMDDQIGAGSYAALNMATDLVQPLRGDEQARCLATFQKHTGWQYTDDLPYGPADKDKIVACLDKIEVELHALPRRNVQAEENAAMVASLKRSFARDFTENDFSKPDQALKWMNDRDQSMYTNFGWWRARLPPQSKIIVWAATVHTAKQLDGVPGFAGRVPFGWYIRHDYQDRAYSLGFTASSGSYKFKQRAAQQLPNAPSGSLESSTLAQGATTAFVTTDRLRTLGSLPSRILGTSFDTASWAQIVDGVVVFRYERSPNWVEGSKPLQSRLPGR